MYEVVSVPLSFVLFIETLYTPSFVKVITPLLSGSVTIKAHAQEIETTKSYVESLSQEEINDMLKMLDEREVHINDMGKKLTLKY